MTPIPSVANLRSLLDRATGLRDGIRSKVAFSTDRIAILGEEEILLSQVTTFLQSLIDREVSVGVQAVERLLTEGLQTVFADQNLRVKALVDIQRGKVSVELVTMMVTKDGSEIEGTADAAFGGAVATVQSLLLRVIIMLRRGLRPLLLLDETLPAINHEYKANTGKFLSALCDRLWMDILLVTHDPALAEAAKHSYRLVGRAGAGVKVELIR